MPLTSLNPNLLGQDSTGASKLNTAGGTAQLHSTGLFAIANNSANNFAVANNGNVGVGTASPDNGVRLDVRDNSGFAAIQLAGTGIATGQLTSDGSTQLTLKNVSNGPLLLGSNNTTRAFIAANGNIGIGTSSPGYPLHVLKSTAGDYAWIGGSSDGGRGIKFTSADDGIYLGAAHTIGVASGYGSILFKNDTYNWMKMTANGSVLINTTVSPVSSGKVAINSGINTSSANVLELQQATDGANKAAAAFGLSIQNGGQNTNAADLYISTASGGSLTERMRISSAGTLMIGGTTNPSAQTQRIITTADGSIGGEHMVFNELRTSSATENYVRFYRNGSQVGGITNTLSATAYVTSSDYRLKENITPMTGALNKISQLKPCTYTWKSTGEAGQGFIAHELQAVVPDAVTGEKDAVNEDGSINPQGVDTSFLVATLTAAIQELKAEFDAYKASHP